MRRSSPRQTSKSAIVFAVGAVLALVFSLVAVINFDASRAQAQAAGEQQVEITNLKWLELDRTRRYNIYSFELVDDATLNSITVTTKAGTMVPNPGDELKQVLIGGEVVSQTGTRVSNKTWKYTFNNPTEVKAGQVVRIHIPNSTTTFGVTIEALGTTGLGTGGGETEDPEPTPDPDPEPSEPVDPPNTPLPGCTNANSRTQTPWPRRELTPEERQRGQAVYVVTSDPSGQERENTQLWRQVIVNGEYDYEQIGGNFGEVGEEVGWVVNALAYNKKDNYLYGISQVRDAVNFKDDPCFPVGHLLQIDPETAKVNNLGLVTEPGTNESAFQGKDLQTRPDRDDRFLNLVTPNDLYGGINAGEFDLDGNLWVSNSSNSGTGKLYKVDIKSVTAVQTSMKMYSEDYALSADGKYLFGIRTNKDGKDGKVVLERLRLNDGSVEPYPITDLRSPVGEDIPKYKTWGKAWTYGNGNLGFGTGGSGADSTLVQLYIGNPDDPKPRLVSIANNAPESYNTDGTSNGLTDIEVDLAIKKTRIKEGLRNDRVGWRLEVSNVGNTTSSGFVINDPVPSEYSDVKAGDVKGPEYFSYYGPKVGDNTYLLEGGQLKPEDKVTFELTAKLPDNRIPVCEPNKATLVPNEKDTNMENNESEEEDPCNVTMEKKVVDANRDGVVDYKDGQLTENFDGKDYKVVKYDIEVHNPSSAALSYRLVDQPNFADGVTPQRIAFERVLVNGKAVGGRGSSFEYRGGDWALSTFANWFVFGRLLAGADVDIGSKDTHTYRVKVLYEMPDSPTKEQRETYECAERNGVLQPGRGLYNQATLTDQKGEKITSEDCINIPLDIELLLKKVGYDAEGQDGYSDEPLDASFALFEANRDGSMGKEVRDVLVGKQGNGTVSVEEGKSYFLVETKAPEGYNLLPNPVKFTVTRGDDGQAKITLDEGQGFPATVVESKDVDQVALQIADTKTGELPKTGGRGIWYYVAAGLALMLGAVGLTGWQRRRA